MIAISPGNVCIRCDSAPKALGSIFYCESCDEIRKRIQANLSRIQPPPAPERDDDDEYDADCSACGGSGGGPDVRLLCGACRGTGRRR